MKKHILLIATFCFISLAFSQAGFDDNVMDVPVDGGILSVVGSAVLFGLYKNRKNKNQD
jgi:hypothetical protein